MECRLPVSVIVPVYNGERTICALLDSLVQQDYPKELYEIIVVDNNSKDRTRSLVERYPVMLLQEQEIQSSYAARNRGIKHAKHSVLAFIDGDCVATRQWLYEGVRALEAHTADLAGGKVEFFLSKQRTVAEMYDAITFFRIGSYIQQQGVTGAGNLFVKMVVFETIGLFPDSVQSGGDIQWTGKAARNGFRLVYAPRAMVKHPARHLKELVKKNFRVGTGLPAIWRSQSMTRMAVVVTAAKLFLPPKPSLIAKSIEERGSRDMHGKLLSLWAVGYLCKLARWLGIWASMR